MMIFFISQEIQIILKKNMAISIIDIKIIINTPDKYFCLIK